MENKNTKSSKTVNLRLPKRPQKVTPTVAEKVFLSGLSRGEFPPYPTELSTCATPSPSSLNLIKRKLRI